MINMNDICLVFLDYEKMKRCLKDLERDTNIKWLGGSNPTEGVPTKEMFCGRGFYELRINQCSCFSKPYLTYGADMECLQDFLEDKIGVMFLIK